MSPDLLIEIEAWFCDHDGDGEFAILPSEHPSNRKGDFEYAEVVFYTTKYHCVCRLVESIYPTTSVAILGRGGLPSRMDLHLLEICSRPVLFLGDADPPDLLAFAWLRSRCPLVWHGVHDGFLLEHGSRFRNNIQIPLSSNELAAMELVRRVLPSYRELLGEYCASLLDNGFKIELEGATMNRGEEGRVIGN